MSETATAAQTKPAAATYAFSKLIVADLDGRLRRLYARVLGLAVLQSIDMDELTSRIRRKPGQQGRAPRPLPAQGRPQAHPRRRPHCGRLLRPRRRHRLRPPHLAEEAQGPPRTLRRRHLRVAFILDPEGHEIELLSVRARSSTSPFTRRSAASRRAGGGQRWGRARRPS
jgi:hypothetical protein